MYISITVACYYVANCQNVVDIMCSSKNSFLSRIIFQTQSVKQEACLRLPTSKDPQSSKMEMDESTFQPPAKHKYKVECNMRYELCM